MTETRPPLVAFLTCSCGRVLHVHNGRAVCESCKAEWVVSVESRPRHEVNTSEEK